MYKFPDDGCVHKYGPIVKATGQGFSSCPPWAAFFALSEEEGRCGKWNGRDGRNFWTWNAMPPPPREKVEKIEDDGMERNGLMDGVNRLGNEGLSANFVFFSTIVQPHIEKNTFTEVSTTQVSSK